MAIDACEACNTLEDTSFDTAHNGIGDKECASLRKNFGLNSNNNPLHDNCQDLSVMLDCMLGQLIADFDMYDICEWKEPFRRLVNNMYHLVKARDCGDCGQWDEINLLWKETDKLWKETEKLWKETQKIWEETERLWEETRKLWEETRRIWAEIYRVWEYIYALEIRLDARIDELDKRVNDRIDELDKRLNDRIDDLEERLTNRIIAVENRVTSIENRLTIIDGQIQDIYNRLDDLDKRVDLLSGSVSYTYLRPNVDYRCTLYNQWTSTNGSPRVGIVETQGEYLLEISSPVGTGYRLTNPSNMVNTCSMFHGDEPPVNTPKSWIAGITFLGNYSALNNLSFRMTSGDGSGIWNLRPTSARASWDAACYMYRNVTGANHTILIAWGSYADGYNQQLSAYGVSTITGAGGINMTLYGAFIK